MSTITTTVDVVNSSPDASESFFQSLYSDVTKYMLCLNEKTKNSPDLPKWLNILLISVVVFTVLQIVVMLLCRCTEKEPLQNQVIAKVNCFLNWIQDWLQTFSTWINNLLRAVAVFVLIYLLVVSEYYPPNQKRIMKKDNENWLSAHRNLKFLLVLKTLAFAYMFFAGLAVFLLQTLNLPVTNMLLLPITVSCFELGAMAFRLENKTKDFTGVCAAPKWNSIIIVFGLLLFY